MEKILKKKKENNKIIYNFLWSYHRYGLFCFIDQDAIFVSMMYKLLLKIIITMKSAKVFFFQHPK